mmetsp:Transcript_125667/g.391303  ORF Transcript_125667/g.391303 Transcript_125667/m.391303 type:complete len:469 (+) Transcript_125667:353-1759(+)
MRQTREGRRERDRAVVPDRLADAEVDVHAAEEGQLREQRAQVHGAGVGDAAAQKAQGQTLQQVQVCQPLCEVVHARVAHSAPVVGNELQGQPLQPSRPPQARGERRQARVPDVRLREVDGEVRQFRQAAQGGAEAQRARVREARAEAQVQVELAQLLGKVPGEVLHVAVRGVRAHESEDQFCRVGVGRQDLWQLHRHNRAAPERHWPSRHCKDGSQLLVDALVVGVLRKGRSVQVWPLRDRVENVHPVGVHGGLRRLKRHRKPLGKYLRRKGTLPLDLAIHCFCEGAVLVLVVGVGDALGDHLRLAPVGRGHVQQQGHLAALVGERDVLLERAPDAGERRRGAAVRRLVVEDQEDALRELQGLVEAGLAGVRHHLATQGVLTVRMGADPEGVLLRLGAPHLRVPPHAEQKILQRLPPPMTYEPYGDLRGGRQQLHHGAVALLGRGHDEPGVQVVQVHELHAQRLACSL